MDSRTIAYALAAVMLVAARFALARGNSQATPSHDAQSINENGAGLWRLLLASFLVQFAELAFIRWIAVEPASSPISRISRSSCAFSVSAWAAPWAPAPRAGRLA